MVQFRPRRRKRLCRRPAQQDGADRLLSDGHHPILRTTHQVIRPPIYLQSKTTLITLQGSCTEQGLRWANHLPSDILSAVLSRCSSDDCASVRRVCSGWLHSLAMYPPFPPLRPQLPFLLMPPHDITPGIDTPPGYVFPLPFPKPLRQPTSYRLPQLAGTQGYNCVGSSHGWLITIGPDSSVSVINPVTADILSPPALCSIDDIILSVDNSSEPEYLLRENNSSFSRYTIVRRVVLSSDPGRDPSFTLLLCVSGLTNCCFTWRDGSNKWRRHLHRPFLVEDVVFSEGKFVAVDLSMNFAIFNFGGLGDLTLDFKRYGPILNIAPEEAFLADNSGGLLLILKWVESNVPRHVQVFKISMSGNVGGSIQLRPTEIRSLAEYALFVGHGCSVCVPVEFWPELKEDSVYFSHVFSKQKSRKEGTEGLPLALHYGGVYKFVISSRVAGSRAVRKVFSVGQPQYSPFWERSKFLWVSPSLNRRHQNDQMSS